MSINHAEQARTGKSGDGGARYAVTPLPQFHKSNDAPLFPTDALPRSAQRLVEESAKAIGCPPDAIALSALVALASAIGNSRVIQPKRSWTESATLFGAVIAAPGEKKTPAIAAATDPARRLENKLQRNHETELDEHARELRAYELEKRDATKAGEPAPPPPREPQAERTRVNDTTVEALMPILKANPRGLLLERDELVGWVKGMDQYKAGGKGNERQFWLSVWSNEPVSVDRKGQQGPVSVLRPFIGVIGSIQPDVLPELSENREDGMLERFLFAYPTTRNAMWTEDEMSEGALVGYRELYQRLRGLSLTKDDDGDPIEVTVTFSPEAKEAYIDVYNEHRREMSAPGFPPYLLPITSRTRHAGCSVLCGASTRKSGFLRTSPGLSPERAGCGLVHQQNYISSFIQSPNQSVLTSSRGSSRRRQKTKKTLHISRR